MKGFSGILVVAGARSRAAVPAVVDSGSVFMLRTSLTAGTGPGGTL